LDILTTLFGFRSSSGG